MSAHQARVLDTVPAFENFARKAGVEGPYRRELLWQKHYQSDHPEVFDALDVVVPGSSKGVAAMVRELSRVRDRVKEAEPVTRRLIDELDPAVAEAMGVTPPPSPLHVVMVGTFTVNAAVGNLGEDVAVFHCLEWFQSEEGERALIGHETAHAWHRLALEAAGQVIPPETDLAWAIFSEGLATQVSRAVAPGLDKTVYYWYGHPGMEEWPAWCVEHRAEISGSMRNLLDDPEGWEAFFGSGTVDGHWRVGYSIADQLVGELGMTLPELVALPVADARRAVVEALGTS